jgi:hypothetical protein
VMISPAFLFNVRGIQKSELKSKAFSFLLAWLFWQHVFLSDSW